MRKLSKKTFGIILYIFIVAILTAADQVTKVIAQNSLYDKDIPLIKDVLELTYLVNNGSAFGILKGKINLFLILTVLIVALMVYVIIRMPFEKKYYPLYIVCTMLTAGAIGNFIDRICFGYVRDFIYFKLINFPVFNVADCFVTISEILAIILILFVYQEKDFFFLSLKQKKNEHNEG